MDPVKAVWQKDKSELDMQSVAGMGYGKGERRAGRQEQERQVTGRLRLSE